ncbi:hypothetical protein USB125703_01600 [Pseudoclavibacter triregionum]|nr:hypothetical protein USB125703_01600 [Pseudoclavibacter triregionum]
MTDLQAREGEGVRPNGARAAGIDATGAAIDPELAELEAPEVVEPELAPPTPEELERAERIARRRLRRRLMLWALPFAIIAVLVAAKLLTMTFLGAQAVRQDEAGDYEGALNTSQLLKTVNVIEPWKAPYDVGTSYLRLGLNDEARAELEAALPLASPEDQCPIRANLAIAIERQGDALLEAGDEAGARELWTQAKAILEEADPSCPSSNSGQSMGESHERIRQKLDPQGSSGGDGQDGQGQGQSQEQQQAQQQQEQQEQTLEQQMQENQQQRQDELEQEQSSGSSGSDRPW